MTDLLQLVIDYIRRQWPSPIAGILLGLSTLVAAAITITALVGELTTGGWAVAVILGLAAIGTWRWSVRTPRHPRHTVGLDIAVQFERARQQERIQSDFVAVIWKLVARSSEHCQFHLIDHAPHVSQKVNDRESAYNLLKKTGGAFLIYGHAKERLIGGTKQHVLELDGQVLHEPVLKSVSDRLSVEFREVLPSTLVISKEGDLFAFKVTAVWIDIVARYIVAMASLISGDLDFAEELFHDLSQRLSENGLAPIPAIAKIKNRLPARIGQVYKARCEILSQLYQLKRDRSYLKQMEPVLDELRKYDPGWYSGNLDRAICAFVLHRDLPKAWKAVRSCTGVRDTTWRYSEAFLHAYEGDLKSAGDSYKRAFRKPPESGTAAIQSEEFIHLVLDEEPDKVQLYFCLGLINLKEKRDLAAARRDLARFLSLTKDGQFQKERDLAQKWLVRLDRELRQDQKLQG